MKIPTLAQAEQAFFQLVSYHLDAVIRTIRSDGEFELYEDAQSTIFHEALATVPLLFEMSIDPDDIPYHKDPILVIVTGKIGRAHV